MLSTRRQATNPLGDPRLCRISVNLRREHPSIDLVSGRRCGVTALAPLGESVDRIRRFRQPGREGGPTLCSSWG